MTVDAHHHVWRTGQGYSWLDDPALAPIRRTFTPDDLRPEITAAGIDRTILVEGGRCDPGEAEILLGHAACTPFIAGVVAWADPATGVELTETLARCRELPGGDRLVGIRAQVQAEPPDYLDRPDVRAGLRTIAAAGLAFDLVIRPEHLPAAARAARDLPAARFVLDHLAKPPIRSGRLTHWAADLAPLAACDNVTAKLSGLVTEAPDRWTPADLTPYVAVALDLFGPDRLMYGSDWPVCLLAAPSYGHVKNALTEALPALPAAAHTAIFGGTATRAYHLP